MQSRLKLTLKLSLCAVAPLFATAGHAIDALLLGDEIRLESRWKPDSFINIEQGVRTVSRVENGWRGARWIVENRNGYVRLKSRRNGCHRKIEKGSPECSVVEKDWWSAQRKSEVVGGRIRLRSRLNGCHLNTEEATLGCIKAQPDWWSAQSKIGYIQRAKVENTTDDITPSQSESDEIARINQMRCPVQMISSNGAADTMCLKIGEYRYLSQDWNDDIEFVTNSTDDLVVELFEHGDFEDRKVTLKCWATKLNDDPENEVSSIKILYRLNKHDQCNGKTGVTHEALYQWGR